MEQKYYVKTLGEVDSDTESCCCDPSFSTADVINAVAALNGGLVDEKHPTLGYFFCSPEDHPYAPRHAPVIVRKYETAV